MAIVRWRIRKTWFAEACLLYPENVFGGSAYSASLSRPRNSVGKSVAEEEGSVLLLAEDHPINRRVLLHQLSIIGFHVDIAEDGQKALELFDRGTYGLVLTDLNMPVMDGFELARAIRRREAEGCGPPTPIIALSANVMPEEVERCMAAGMDDFAGKPTSMPVLADKLRRWLPHIEWPNTAPAPNAGTSELDTTTSQQSGVVDRAVLDELTGGDDDLAEAILADYIDSLRTDMAALRDALAGCDAAAVRRHAHRVNGASRTVGAHHVTRAAERLEAGASSPEEDWPSLRAMADELETAAVEAGAEVSRATAAR
jgi:CheY-like chemotaxis protein